VSGRRLLIVDDDEDIRRIARLSLERLGGWTVVDAGTAEDALAAAAQGGFTAVLCDVMMPEVSGPELVARLRPALGDQVPVIFLTAKVQPADVEALLAAGGAAVIAKPFDPMGLPAEVEAALGS
jgi:two-component system, OmpR family, response regulator